MQKLIKDGGKFYRPIDKATDVRKAGDEASGKNDSDKWGPIHYFIGEDAWGSDCNYRRPIPSMIERDGWLEWDGSDEEACKAMWPKLETDESIFPGESVWTPCGRVVDPRFHREGRYRRRLPETEQKPESLTWIPREEYDEAKHGNGPFIGLWSDGVVCKSDIVRRVFTHFISWPAMPPEEAPVDRYIRENNIPKESQQLVRETWAAALEVK